MATSGIGMLNSARALDASNPYRRLIPEDKRLDPAWVKSLSERGEKDVYSSDVALQQIGMPVGGCFTGTVYLSGDGRLWHWDIFNRESYGVAPPDFKWHGRDMKYYWGASYAFPLKADSSFRQEFVIRANGQEVKLDRTGFQDVRFRGEYPRAIVSFQNGALPVSARLEAFSPFIPLDQDDSGLPLTVMQYTVKNEGPASLDLEIAGLMENAVCMHARDYQSGVIRNQVIEGGRFTGIACSARSHAETPESEAREDVVFEAFEGDVSSRWTGKGELFENGPLVFSGTVDSYTPRTEDGGEPSREAVRSYGLKTGTLTSRPFTIEHRYITTQISGDRDPATCGLSVVVNGETVATANGMNSKRALLQCIDLTRYRGREAHLVIRDEISRWLPHQGNTMGIGVGPIRFTDRPVGQVIELEALPDFGTMSLALLEQGRAVKASALSGSDESSREGELGTALVGEVSKRARLAPGGGAVFTFVISWHFPNYSNRNFQDKVVGHYYGSRFASSTEVVSYLAAHFERLAFQTRTWVDTWYNSSLPYWFLDRTMSNASTLATTTCHRFEDGRFWGWEGVACCSGTCTHVWHYAQSMSRLFPELERETRDKVDFGIGMAKEGRFAGGISHRVNTGPGLPADDGQLGRILSVYREHQMTTDNAFLESIWPRVKTAMAFITAHDPELKGVMEGSQRNTLDGEWFGTVSWLDSLYIAALRACEAMATELGDTEYAAYCKKIADSGAREIEKLFDGEYFIQEKVPDGKVINENGRETVNHNGSGRGCFIDQILGQSWAHWVGLGHIFNPAMQATALRSLYRYNFIPDYGPFREEFPHGRVLALKGDAGLLMCTWPKVPVSAHEKREKFFFEFMTGFEWQAAAHMIFEGLENPDLLEHGLAVARAIHDRYGGELRNPYNEIECGDHYSRAMASYGAYQAVCGYQYHGPKKQLAFAPRLTPESFRAAFTTAEGWGSYSQTIARKQMQADLRLDWGSLSVQTLRLYPRGMKTGQVTVTLDGKELNATSATDQDGMMTIALQAAVRVATGQVLNVVLR